MRYVIRRISPLSSLIYGLLLGLFSWIIPGFFLGWGVRSAVHNLRDWLNGFQITIPLPVGEGITLDLSTILPLSNTQAQLESLAAQDATLVFAISLGTIAAGMLLTGLAALLGSIIYNIIAGLFGGAEITLDALDESARPVTVKPLVTSSPQPRPAVSSPASTAPAPIVPPPRRPEPEKVGLLTSASWLVAGESGERWPLSDGVTRIGSDPNNDVVVAGLAPQHAEIRRESGRYLIYDLGSRRTWVNDTQVAAVHMLKDGFRLKLGQADFQIRMPVTNPASRETR